MEIKKLQFLLRHLQEKENYDIGVDFDCSSIDENYFFDFIDHHFWDLSRKIDARPVFTSFPSRKLLDSLESICLEYEHSSNPSMESPPLRHAASKGQLRRCLTLSIFLSHPKKKIASLPILIILIVIPI